MLKAYNSAMSSTRVYSEKRISDFSTWLSRLYTSITHGRLNCNECSDERMRATVVASVTAPSKEVRSWWTHPNLEI